MLADPAIKIIQVDSPTPQQNFKDFNGVQIINVLQIIFLLLTIYKRMQLR